MADWLTHQICETKLSFIAKMSMYNYGSMKLVWHILSHDLTCLRRWSLSLAGMPVSEAIPSRRATMASWEVARV